jgi:hypothetical protein
MWKVYPYTCQFERTMEVNLRFEYLNIPERLLNAPLQNGFTPSNPKCSQLTVMKLCLIGFSSEQSNENRWKQSGRANFGRMQARAIQLLQLESELQQKRQPRLPTSFAEHSCLFQLQHSIQLVQVPNKTYYSGLCVICLTLYLQTFRAIHFPVNFIGPRSLFEYTGI